MKLGTRWAFKSSHDEEIVVTASDTTDLIYVEHDARTVMVLDDSEAAKLLDALSHAVHHHQQPKGSQCKSKSS